LAEPFTYSQQVLLKGTRVATGTTSVQQGFEGKYLLLSTSSAPYVHAPSEPGDTWLEDYAYDGYWKPIREVRRKEVRAVHAGEITELAVTNLDACPGVHFIIEARNGAVTLDCAVLGRSTRNGVEPAPKDECWKDARLSAQLGVSFAFAAPSTGVPFDDVDLALSLLRPWPRRDDVTNPRIVVKAKGRKQSVLGPSHVFHAKLHLEDGSVSMGHVGEEWIEDDEGDFVRLDGTNLVVEAHLTGKVTYTLTSPDADWDGVSTPVVSVQQRETRPTRIDLVCGP
jgi:hypothetical protein